MSADSILVPVSEIEHLRSTVSSFGVGVPEWARRAREAAEAITKRLPKPAPPIFYFCEGIDMGGADPQTAMPLEISLVGKLLAGETRAQYRRLDSTVHTSPTSGDSARTS